MFVQVVQGKVSDPAAVKEALDRWVAELSADAPGWLGTTAGVTDDGQFVALARFQDEDAARRNSERPEQDKWWGETATLFTGQPVFKDSTDVTVDLRGDPDDAGFVQVMQGRTTDPERARELMNDDSTDWSAFRPDILGSVSIGHADGEWSMANYFTSEADARAGEQKEPPPELQAQMEEMMKLSAGEPTFLDLREPWMYSP